MSSEFILEGISIQDFGFGSRVFLTLTDDDAETKFTSFDFTLFNECLALSVVAFEFECFISFDLTIALTLIFSGSESEESEVSDADFLLSILEAILDELVLAFLELVSIEGIEIGRLTGVFSCSLVLFI